MVSSVGGYNPGDVSVKLHDVYINSLKLGKSMLNLTIKQLNIIVYEYFDILVISSALLTV